MDINREHMLDIKALASYTYIPEDVLTHFETQAYITPDYKEDGVSYYSKETAEYIRTYRETFLLTYKKGNLTIAEEYENREYGEELERDITDEPVDFEEEEPEEEEPEEDQDEMDEDFIEWEEEPKQKKKKPVKKEHRSNLENLGRVNDYVDTSTDRYQPSFATVGGRLDSEESFEQTFDSYVDAAVNQYFNRVNEEAKITEDGQPAASSYTPNMPSDSSSIIEEAEQRRLGEKLAEANREYHQRQNEIRENYEAQLKQYTDPKYQAEQLHSVDVEYKKRADEVIREEITQRREWMQRLENGEISIDEYQQRTAEISEYRHKQLDNLNAEKENAVKETNMQQVIKTAEIEKEYRIQSNKNNMERALATGLAVEAVDASKFKSDYIIREMQSRNQETLSAMKIIFAAGEVYGDKIYESGVSANGQLNLDKIFQKADQEFQKNPEPLKRILEGTSRSESHTEISSGWNTSSSDQDNGRADDSPSITHYGGWTYGHGGQDNGGQENGANGQNTNGWTKKGFDYKVNETDRGTFFDTASKGSLPLRQLWQTANKSAEGFVRIGVRQVMYSNDMGRGFAMVAPYFSAISDPFEMVDVRNDIMSAFHAMNRTNMVSLRNHMDRLGISTDRLFVNGHFVGSRADKAYWSAIQKFNTSNKYTLLKAKLQQMGTTLDKVDLNALVADKAFFSALTDEEKQLIWKLQARQKNNVELAKSSIAGTKAAFNEIWKKDPKLRSLLKNKRLDQLSISDINKFLKDPKMAEYHDLFKELKGLKKLEAAAKQGRRTGFFNKRAMLRHVRNILKQTDLGRGIDTTIQYVRAVRMAGGLFLTVTKGTAKVGLTVTKFGAKKVLGPQRYAKLADRINNTRIVKAHNRAKDYKARSEQRRLLKKDRRREKIRVVKVRVKNKIVTSKPVAWFKRTKFGKIAGKTFGTGKKVVGGAFGLLKGGLASFFGGIHKLKMAGIAAIAGICVIWLVMAAGVSIVGAAASTIFGFFESDPVNPVTTIAGNVMQKMIDKETDWYDDIYSIGEQTIDSTEEQFLGAYGQSLEGRQIGEDYVVLHFVDQTGAEMAYTTNIKEILSMGAVYVEQDFTNSIVYEDYCIAMWNISHKWDPDLPWEIEDESWYNTNRYSVVFGKSVCTNISGIEESTGNEVITCENVVYCGQGNEGFTDENQRLLEESHNCKVVTWQYAESITRDSSISGTYSNDGGSTFFDAAENSYDIQNGTRRYTFTGTESIVYSRYELWTYTSNGTLRPTGSEQVFAGDADTILADNGEWRKISYDHTDTRYRYTVDTATVTWNCPGHCGGHITADVSCRIVNFEGGTNLFVLSDDYYSPRSEDGECLNRWSDTLYDIIFPIDPETGVREMPEKFMETDESGNRVEGDMAEWARNIYAQDWYDLYGISLSQGGMASATLTESEIQEILDALPEDLSEERYNVVKWALESVGQIPYYFGGKPDVPGYEGNNFGSIIGPDEKGRTLKGLDCSGFLEWVYWSVTSVQYECGAREFASIGTDSYANPQPGDLFAYSTASSGSGWHCGLIVGVNADGTFNIVHTPGMPYNTVLYETGYTKMNLINIRSVLN